MRKLTIEEFIERAKKIHNNYYNYSKAEYINANTKVCIICPKHGEFWQKPSSHIMTLKSGCPNCANKKIANDRKLTTEEFIERAKEVHGNRYDYSKVEYINAHIKIKIICKIHGVFFKTPNNHVLNKHQGCPKCKNKSIGEERIKKFLIKNRIDFLTEKKFKKCKDKRQLPFDFYLFDYDLLIEFDGRQHFFENNNWGKESLLYTKRHDEIKNIFCKNNNIKLIRIPFWEINNVEKILTREIYNGSNSSNF
jgi:very-short-patch-repair endonuclease